MEQHSKPYINLHFDILLIRGTRDKTLPGFVSLKNDISGILLVLGFTAESENIFGLSIRDFVDTEPFVSSTNKTRKVLFNILNI
jgi:hypothetical protein